MKMPSGVLVAGILMTSQAVWADVAEDVSYLQKRWAEVNYHLADKAQLTAFEQLVAEAEEFTGENPDSAELLIWSGIVKSSYAGAKGGLGALGLAKESRDDLEQALEIDDTALEGSAYTSLGTLYFKVPGWPVGFGNDDKAGDLLKKALALNPDGIDPNYFYGTWLIDEKRYDEARDYLNKAAQAGGRPGREVADAGRQQEISEALQAIRNK